MMGNSLADIEEQYTCEEEYIQDENMRKRQIIKTGTLKEG